MQEILLCNLCIVYLFCLFIVLWLCSLDNSTALSIRMIYTSVDPRSNFVLLEEKKYSNHVFSLLVDEWVSVLKFHWHGDPTVPVIPIDWVTCERWCRPHARLSMHVPRNILLLVFLAVIVGGSAESCMTFSPPLLLFNETTYFVDACFAQQPRPCKSEISANAFCQYVGYESAKVSQLFPNCLGATFVGNVTAYYAPICIPEERSNLCCGGFSLIQCCQWNKLLSLPYILTQNSWVWCD